MDYSYLNQAGFDPSTMSSLSASAAAASVSEANFYSDLSAAGTCPSSAAAAMMPGNYGSLGSRYHSSVMRSAYGPSPGAMAGTPSGSPSSCGVIPRNQTEHHRQSMFGAAGMGLNCKFLNLIIKWSKSDSLHFDTP